MTLLEQLNAEIAALDAQIASLEQGNKTEKVTGKRGRGRPPIVDGDNDQAPHAHQQPRPRQRLGTVGPQKQGFRCGACDGVAGENHENQGGKPDESDAFKPRK